MSTAHAYHLQIENATWTPYSYLMTTAIRSSMSGVYVGTCRNKVHPNLSFFRWSSRSTLKWRTHWQTWIPSSVEAIRLVYDVASSFCGLKSRFLIQDATKTGLFLTICNVLLQQTKVKLLLWCQFMEENIRRKIIFYVQTVTYKTSDISNKKPSCR